jgi:prepilin-type N-terminal cleavage/methylation domain-containing protein
MNTTVSFGLLCQTSKRQSREAASGFTLVELLVVIAMIGVLIGLLIPSVQAVREVSRRSLCQHNLVELSLAITSYHDRQNYYPVGTLDATGPIRSIPEGYHHNWLAALLPHMDENVIADKINSQVSVYATENKLVRSVALPRLRCPSATGVQDFTSCYAAIHSSIETPIDTANNGVFVLNRPTRQDEITDGLAYTLFLGEKLSHPQDDLGWMSGTRSTLRNVGGGLSPKNMNLQGPLDLSAIPADTDPSLYVGSLQSHHPEGVHLLTGGGEVTFRSTSMDALLLAHLANKSDQSIPPGQVSDTDPVDAFLPNTPTSSAPASDTP